MSERAESREEERRAPKGDERTRAQLVDRLARRISNELDLGYVAELRRYDPRVERIPSSSAFWWLFVGDVAPDGRLSEVETERWAKVLSLMALGAGLHEPSEPFGRAVANAGVAEPRFERLLRASEHALWPYLRRVVGFLVAANQAFDQIQLARLLLVWTASERDRLKLRLAQDYYRRRREQEQAA